LCDTDGVFLVSNRAFHFLTWTNADFFGKEKPTNGVVGKRREIFATEGMKYVGADADQAKKLWIKAICS